MPRSTALGIIEMIARASSVAGLMAPRDIPVQRLPEPPRLDSPATRTETDDEPPSLTSPSGLVLVAANLMPLVGVFYLGWDLANVMVLYWAESAVIGFYTAVKIAVVGRIAAIVAVPFFVGHFGGFMAGHFLLIHSLFVHNGQFSGVEPEPVEAWSRLFAPVGWSLASLFLSHGVSFVTNFIGRREYVSVTVKDLMAAPYSRIVAMQLTLLFGGWVLLALKSPLPALALLMGMKTVVDFRAHQQEHRELAARLSADKRDHRVMLKSGDLSA